MDIAGTRTDANWETRKIELATTGSPELWEKTFDEFMKERIETRYLAPMRAIADIGKKAGQEVGEGFSIVALFCTLIEFLEGCEQGMNFDQTTKPGELHKYGFGPKGKELFNEFLKREPFNALLGVHGVTFYSGVRCGLLHEARTCGGWIIRTGGPPKVLVETQGSDIILYRDQLEPILQEYLADYRRRLADKDNRALRDNFIIKWDHLATS